MRLIRSTIIVLAAVSSVFSGSKYPVILLEIPDSVITYTYKGEYKKHKDMQSNSYAKQIYRSFRRNIEFCSELYCIGNDSRNIQIKVDRSGKNAVPVTESGTKKNGADLIIYFQRMDITLKSTYFKPQQFTMNTAMPDTRTVSTLSNYVTSIKVSAVISVFSTKENRVLLTKEISSTKRDSNPHAYEPKDFEKALHTADDTDIKKEGNVGGSEVEEAVSDLAGKFIKNTAWEIKNKHPQKEIVE